MISIRCVFIQSTSKHYCWLLWLSVQLLEEMLLHGELLGYLESET